MTPLGYRAALSVGRTSASPPSGPVATVPRPGLAGLDRTRRPPRVLARPVQVAASADPTGGTIVVSLRDVAQLPCR
jgi:hypothetical protein